MPLSSVVVAGNPALASQINNLRSDALALTVSGTSGEAFSIRDLVYVDPSDNRVYKADADIYNKGDSNLEFFFAASAATGAAQAVTIYVEGGYITGFSGLTPNTFYFPSGTPGAITTTIGKYGCSVAYAISATEILFVKGTKKDHRIIETVTAGANWVDGQMVYLKKSDTRWYPMDTTIAESGICEVWGFAVITHTGGAGSTQQVYLQGSVINAPAYFTAGAMYYSTTGGASYVANAIPGHDDYFRQVCYAILSTRIHIVGEQNYFLPTGIQEKGYCAAGDYSSGTALSKSSVGVCFKRTMSNVPSSVTLTTVSSQYAATPTANNITRFGFRLNVAELSNPSNAETWWAGYYTTVGN